MCLGIEPNLKTFREGKSELGWLGSGQSVTNRPNWSAQQIEDECAKRGSSHVSKWIIGRTLARGEYFKCVPQKIPPLIDEHKRKREEWCIAHRDYNFDNVVFTYESRFQFD